mmetsp:Transcript_9342/g.23808  ORF Transcript_9342/g.23808 Transcript_9342/m.23808 type:complete len:255 (+) Transcript_9342:93-857(+)
MKALHVSRGHQTDIAQRNQRSRSCCDGCPACVVSPGQRDAALHLPQARVHERLCQWLAQALSEGQQVAKDSGSRDLCASPGAPHNQRIVVVALRRKHDDVVAALQLRKRMAAQVVPQLHTALPSATIHHAHVAQHLTHFAGILCLLGHLGVMVGQLRQKLLSRLHTAQRLRHKVLYRHVLQLHVQATLSGQCHHLPGHIHAGHVVPRVRLSVALGLGARDHGGEGWPVTKVVKYVGEGAREDALDAQDAVARLH